MPLELSRQETYGDFLTGLIDKIREVEAEQKIRDMNIELMQLGYSLEEITKAYHLLLEQ